MHDEIGDQELTYSSWDYKPVIIAETRHKAKGNNNEHQGPRKYDSTANAGLFRDIKSRRCSERAGTIR